MGPIVSVDGKAIETILQVNLGSKGYADANKAVRRDPRDHQLDADGLVSHITGPLGAAAEQQRVREHQRLAAGSALAVVIVISLITYRSPVLWLLPVISSAWR